MHGFREEPMATDIPLQLKVKDIFVPGGNPKYTYQSRDKYQIESKLKSAIERMNKFIVVAGQTKSGKTVLVRRIVPKENSVWIEGGHINKIEDIWQTILDELTIPNSMTKSESTQSEEISTLEVGAGVKPFGIGSEIKNVDSSKFASTKGLSSTHNINITKAAVSAVSDSNKVLVIDDFHYLDKAIQTSIIRSLKPAVFDGLKVVLVLIPHRMHQAAQAEMDVDGRTYTIPVPQWETEELFLIGKTGFDLLNISFTNETVTFLVNECFNSPHLMQDFCSNLCYEQNISEQFLGPKPFPEIKTPEPLDGFFKTFSESISPETFKALRRGPERTNRKERTMSSGGTCDTYEAVLLALHELEGVTPVDWSSLRKALLKVLSEAPQQHEVTRALEKMDEIAKTRHGEPAIDYVKEQGELHLVDPFFRYYLKWNTSILDDKNK